MALTQLGSPYPVFTDLDGTPLDGGFVYIGVADDNPETAPILVYYDQELTQIAPQPLRTVNGYVMRNGAPAILYADATFSVTVRNRNGALVLYAGQSFGFLPGGGLRSQNNLSDVDSAATSLQNLGLTATAAELNFSDGVTSNIQTQLDGKAPLSSPALTGTPTAPTAAAGTNDTQIATTAFVQTAAGGSSAAIPTTSGTSASFASIPAGVQRVTVSLNGVDVAGTDSLFVTLGTASGIVTSGYNASFSSFAPSAQDATSGITAAFAITRAGGASLLQGEITFTRTDTSSNIWTGSGQFWSGDVNEETSFSFGTSPDLGGELTQVRIASGGGTNLLDGGSFRVFWS